jgi:hypothetical protein
MKLTSGLRSAPGCAGRVAIIAAIFKFKSFSMVLSLVGMVIVTIASRVGGAALAESHDQDKVRTGVA